ncbi:MAG: hypothetical protein HY059_22880 [Proteobacteria bacterium]|nr:hypothetical protein [Pseudomonadota bacterium]
MGILKSREEHLPVTCAVLKEEDRKKFFEAVQAQRHGKTDQVARSLGLPNSVVADWIEGKTNIPYHLLQRLSHEYGIDMPPIGELRREIQPVAAMASATPAAVIPKQPKRGGKLPTNITIERTERPDRDRGPRRERSQGKQNPKQAKGPKPGKQRQGKKQRPPQGGQHHGGHPQGQNYPQGGHDNRQLPRAAPQHDKQGLPVLSEALAYWVGTSLAGAKPSPAGIVFLADQRTGPSFADIWSRRAKELFGREAVLVDKEEGVREATFDPAGLEEFFKRLGFGAPEATPAVPRWVWSNPAWKNACLRGLLDARAAFDASPALIVEGLPESLARSVQKMAAAMKLEVKENAGTLAIEGKENVENYFNNVGADNLKLRDQMTSHFGHPGRGALAPAPQPRPQGQQRPGTPHHSGQQHGGGGGGGRGRRRGRDRDRNRHGGGQPQHQRKGPPRLPADPDEPLDFDEAMRLMATLPPEKGVIEPPGAPKLEQDPLIDPSDATAAAKFAASTPAKKIGPPSEPSDDEIDAAALRAAERSAQPSAGETEPPPDYRPPKPETPKKPFRRRTVYRGRPGY